MYCLGWGIVKLYPSTVTYLLKTATNLRSPLGDWRDSMRCDEVRVGPATLCFASPANNIDKRNTRFPLMRLKPAVF